MKDNAITTTDGIEVYKHNINYYADEYIRNELEIDHVDTDSKQIVKDNFVDMLFYICDHIEKPDNADIKALDYIFNVYVLLILAHRYSRKLLLLLTQLIAVRHSLSLLR